MTQTKLINVDKYFKTGPKRSDASILHSPIKWLRSFKNEKRFGLKNITLTLASGEIVGVIGQNGSGKSTLLRTIAGIYQPNKGQVIADQKVVSLLDISAGAIRRLTVKENIVLRGLYYGLTLKEIKHEISTIVTLSNIQPYLHSKLKELSSGMREKLAFTTALQSDPKVLLIDELFATSDEEFKTLMIQKIKNLAEAGKTIIITSHEMDLIKNCCTRTVVLNKGQVVFDGKPTEAVDYYLNHLG